MAFELRVKPSIWKGRYDRIMGNRSVFHIRWDSQKQRWWPMVEWYAGGEVRSCWFVEGDGAATLAQSVNQIKSIFTGAEGGAFLINEWGQVLVPVDDDESSRILLGEVTGRIDFESPLNPGETIDLSDDLGLRCGDAWNKPYVGVPYHLSARDKIYFRNLTRSGDDICHLESQDSRLVRLLRSVRRYGPVRFIVTPGGLVLTKRPATASEDEDLWEPVYVGRIDFTKWFHKEEG